MRAPKGRSSALRAAHRSPRSVTPAVSATRVTRAIATTAACRCRATTGMGRPSPSVQLFPARRASPGLPPARSASNSAGPPPPRATSYSATDRNRPTHCGGAAVRTSADPLRGDVPLTLRWPPPRPSRAPSSATAPPADVLHLALWRRSYMPGLFDGVALCALPLMGVAFCQVASMTGAGARPRRLRAAAVTSSHYIRPQAGARSDLPCLSVSPCKITGQTRVPIRTARQVGSATIRPTYRDDPATRVASHRAYAGRIGHGDSPARAARLLLWARV